MVLKEIIELEVAIRSAIKSLRENGFSEGSILPTLRLKLVEVYEKEVRKWKMT